MKRAASPPIPLARLLAMAYRELIVGLHARLAHRGYTDVRPTYGYVLLALRERPLQGSEIAALLGVTKQAASKLVDAMANGGYVTRAEHRGDARAKSVALTPRGRRFLQTVESIYRELEAQWARATGRRRLEALRADLRLVVAAAHGGKLPPVRPTSGRS